MAEFDFEYRFDALVDRVYETIADRTNSPLYEPNVKEAKLRSGVAGEAGAVYDIVEQDDDELKSYSLQVTEAVPNERVVVRADAEFETVVRMELEEEADGTKLKMNLSLYIPRPIAHIVREAITSALDTDMAGLEKFLAR